VLNAAAVTTGNFQAERLVNELLAVVERVGNFGGDGGQLKNPEENVSCPRAYMSSSHFLCMSNVMPSSAMSRSTLSFDMTGFLLRQIEYGVQLVHSGNLFARTAGENRLTASGLFCPSGNRRFRPSSVTHRSATTLDSGHSTVANKNPGEPGSVLGCC
jgi:hypothetical protein